MIKTRSRREPCNRSTYLSCARVVPRSICGGRGTSGTHSAIRGKRYALALLISFSAIWRGLSSFHLTFIPVHPCLGTKSTNPQRYKQSRVYFWVLLRSEQRLRRSMMQCLWFLDACFNKVKQGKQCPAILEFKHRVEPCPHSPNYLSLEHWWFVDICRHMFSFAISLLGKVYYGALRRLL